MAGAAIFAALKLLGEALDTELVKNASSRATAVLSSISELEVRMGNIISELRVMQAYLNHIDMHNQSNEPFVAWIGEVNKVANRIIDIVDEFINLVNHHNNFGGIIFNLINVFKAPKSLLALKQISSKLEAVEMSLKRVGEIKERWSIKDGRTGNGKSKGNETSVQVAISSHFIDEHEIIGIDENRNKLSSLINSEESSLSVISVWGMAGVGKTTLVTNVFKKERTKFTCHAWICISQIYNIDQVLRNLFYELCKSEQHTNPINLDNMDTRELKETIRDFLQQRKYLIILDDVWNQDSYFDIREVFVDSREGSRIVITSRMVDVASLTRERNMLELRPLPVEESWNLFCRKAFPFETNHECPLRLAKWAKQIASKCDGLPLALVSLGSVLSSCATIEYDWKRVHDQLSWELENNISLDRLRSVLNLSFNYLPRYLKNCFLYCSMFPEDHLIERKKLIRLWIAEDFVEQRGGSTLEETAESYLFELINRSMLQVVKRNYSGRVKRCRMHDTLRELAISICMKENFGLLHGDNKLVNINESVRRLSIIKSGNSVGYNIHIQQLRTLMSFDLSVHSMLLIQSILKCRCLTVLSLENLNIESVPDNIGDLFNLHYLGLRNTKVKLLPNSIKKLHSLQTLDLMLSKIQGIPDGIEQLKKLRHLFAETIVDGRDNSFRNRTGINLPKGVFYLKELQTIQSVESNDLVVKDLGNLTQLTSFRIRNVKENQSAELCRSLSKMSSFSYLSICASNENEVLHLEDLKIPQIHKLELKGRLKERILESLLFQISGECIQELWLEWSQLQTDPLSSLSHCKNLSYLNLQRAFEGDQLTFQAGWFPKLKMLVLRQMPNLVQIEMKQGTMVNLEEIVLWELKQLMDIPEGIEHLASLKWMGCDDMPPEFGGLAKGISLLFHFTCGVF